MKYKLRKGKFTGARGGSSKFLLIRCSKCTADILLYQKDGPGGLIRMYLDKIHAPENLANLTHQVSTKSDLPSLHCYKCSLLIAVPMLYEQENRLAYKLLVGTFRKIKSDGTFN